MSVSEKEPKIKNGPTTWELDKRMKKLEQEVEELKRRVFD